MAFAVAVGGAAAMAEDVQLVEQKDILIRCKRPPEATWKNLPVLKEAGVVPTDQEYTYRLWLPPGYLADPEKRWPCLFITSAGGNAARYLMKDWIAENGFVAVMLMESSNKAGLGVSFGNFLAAHDDVVGRVRIQEGMKWATGMSGGARCSAVFVQMRPGFSGLILQAAGGLQHYEGPKQAQYIMDDIRRAPWIAVAMTMGKQDPNMTEVPKMPLVLASGQYRLFPFEGGHVWAPKEVFSEAADWVMQRVMVEGPPNPALQPVYLQQFRERVAAAQAATEPWTRFKLLNGLGEFAKARGLGAAPEARDLLPRVSGELSRMRSDPAVGRQLQAADALARLEQGGKRMPPAIRREQLKAFLKQYADTDAVARAQELLDGMPESDAPSTGRPSRR
jgi:hypothetical protein